MASKFVEYLTTALTFVVFAYLFLDHVDQVGAQFGWQTRDAFDEIKRRFDAVTPGNCEIKQRSDLYLPPDTVTHKPDIKDININPVFPNRTALLHLHNMALNRAFFWSYVLQSRFIRPAINDTYDPGMMYYFLSTVADVAANKWINTSAIYFSPNSSFSPSYRGFFNKTFPLFAPRTFRHDDFNDPIHLERISTLNTFVVRDLGSNAKSDSQNYTSDYYRINEYYTAWLPDKVNQRHDTKTTYNVEIRYANNTNETYTFHGPPGADETPGPVAWTRPYFDCGRSNKWIIGASVPIADIFPRHTSFRHVEYPTYTAVSVMEMDFERIDINQCPIGDGNPAPNMYAGTARCKEGTTECDPLDGYGFRRGGYQCRCRPGFRLPYVDRRPYLGEIVERSPEQIYRHFFECSKIGWVQKMPVQWEKAAPELREKYLDMHMNYRNFTTRPFDYSTMTEKKPNPDAVIKFINSVNNSTCRRYKKHELILNGDVGYGAEKQFNNEALQAVRLANFISSYLQIVDPDEVFPGKRLPDKPLSEDQMFGETLSLLLGDTRIWSAGVFWERNKFSNRTLFAPFAYKTQLNTRNFKLEDLARINDTDKNYLSLDYFKLLKNRWATNFEDLETYYLKIHLRNNETGSFLRKFEQYPTSYKAANVKHGFWSTPYFDCDGPVKKWLITYAAPFFGPDSLRLHKEFKGIVAVSVELLNLDINQCPSEYYTPNAFKSSDKCDDASSYCVPIQGRGFDTGGYKCECKQGFEYPFEDPITYYDGQLVEAEFINLVKGNETRYDMFKCRLAKGSSITSFWLFPILGVLALYFFN